MSYEASEINSRQCCCTVFTTFRLSLPHRRRGDML